MSPADRRDFSVPDLSNCVTPDTIKFSKSSLYNIKIKGIRTIVWVPKQKPKPEIEPLVRQIITAGQMNRTQQFQLTSIALSKHQITDEERRQIDRAFDYLQTGRVKLVD